MDQYTHDRLQDEAIAREQERASLRKPRRARTEPAGYRGRPALPDRLDADAPGHRIDAADMETS